MLDSIEGLTTYTELNGEYVVVYNKAEGLCADVNMRQAINAILDANEILLGAYNTPDFFREEISFMPAETATWYTDAGKENAHLKDLDLAKEYLEKANYNGETVRILASPSSAALAGGAVVVQSELAAAGINAELITPDYTSYSAYRNDPTKYDLFFASLIPVAVPTLQIYLSSSWAGFTNDQKIFDAVKEMDATADTRPARSCGKSCRPTCGRKASPPPSSAACLSTASARTRLKTSRPSAAHRPCPTSESDSNGRLQLKTLA